MTQRRNFEIPTAKLEFSTTASSMTVSPSDCDNDGEMAVDHCRSRLGTLSSHAGIKNPRFAVGISLLSIIELEMLAFLRATALLVARICYGNSVCLSVRLSVCLSVTRLDQSKTVEVRIMQVSPYSSPIPLVCAR